MKSALKNFLFNPCWYVTVLVLATILLTYQPWRINEVIATWRQPEHIDYHSFDPYEVKLMEDGNDSIIPLTYDPAYVLRITRVGDTPYGHSFRISLFAGGRLKEHVDRSKLEWSREGVEFIAPSGHRVFIPKTAFVGGR